MRLGERVSEFFSIFLKTEQVEEKSPEIELLDLRDEKRAYVHGVEPGYYFTVFPTYETELANPNILNNFSPKFMMTLSNKGLISRSDERIPIDDIEGGFIDPEASWKFTLKGYILDQLLLVVKAEPFNSEEDKKVTLRAHAWDYYRIEGVSSE